MLIEGLHAGGQRDGCGRLLMAASSFLYHVAAEAGWGEIKRFRNPINNFGYSIRLQNGELHPKEMQKLLAKGSRIPGGGASRETGAPLHETGEVHDGLHGTFRSYARTIIPTSPSPIRRYRIFRSTGSSREPSR